MASRQPSLADRQQAIASWRLRAFGTLLAEQAKQLGHAQLSIASGSEFRPRNATNPTLSQANLTASSGDA